MIAFLAQQREGNRQGRFGKLVSLVPLSVVSLVSLTLVFMAVGEILEYESAEYLSFDPPRGLFSNLLWWRIFVDELLTSLVFIAIELAIAVLLVRLLWDFLPLRGLRFTLLLSIWLIPSDQVGFVFNQLVEWLVSQQLFMQIQLPASLTEAIAHIWYYSTMSALVLVLFWKTGDQGTYLIDKVYHFNTMIRLLLAISTPRSNLLIPALVLFCLHFDPALEWTAMQQAISEQTLNRTFDYTKYVDLANSLSFTFELLLLILVLTSLRRFL